MKFKKYGIYAKSEDFFTIIFRVTDDYILGVDYSPKEDILYSNKEINSWLYTHYDLFDDFSIFQIEAKNYEVDFINYGYLGEVVNPTLREAMKLKFEETLDHIGWSEELG